MSARILTVKKRPFLTALKSLRISSRARQKDEAIIGFTNNHLSIELQGGRVEVPAKGHWSGRARVAARSLIPIATFPPDPDPLPIRFEDDRFYIAGWSVNATWHEANEQPLEIPDDADCIEVLALRQRYSELELEAAGVLKHVRSAEQFAKTQIAQAVTLLEPVGIQKEDIDRLIEEKISRLEIRAIK